MTEYNEYNEYMLTIWQPIAIRFGPVKSRSHDEAKDARPQDFGISIDNINRKLAECMPEGCWAEWSDELPINTLVFSLPSGDDDVMYDVGGNRVTFIGVAKPEGKEVNNVY